MEFLNNLLLGVSSGYNATKQADAAASTAKASTAQARLAELAKNKSALLIGGGLMILVLILLFKKK